MHWAWLVRRTVLSQVNLPRRLIMSKDSRRLEVMVTQRLVDDLGGTLESMLTAESQLSHEVLKALAKDMHLKGYSATRIDDATVGQGKLVRNLVEAACLKPGYIGGVPLLPAAYALVEGILYPKGISEPEYNFYYGVFYWDALSRLWRSYNEQDTVNQTDILNIRLPNEIPALELQLAEVDELHKNRPSLCDALIALHQN